MALQVNFKPNAAHIDGWVEGVSLILDQDNVCSLLPQIKALVLEYLKNNYSAAPHSFLFFSLKRFPEKIDFVSTDMGERLIQIGWPRSDPRQFWQTSLIERRNGAWSIERDKLEYPVLTDRRDFFAETVGMRDKVIYQTVFMSQVSLAVRYHRFAKKPHGWRKAQPPRNALFVAGACSRDRALVFAATNMSTVAMYRLEDLGFMGQYLLGQRHATKRMSANETTLVMMDLKGTCLFWDIDTHQVVSSLTIAMTLTMVPAVFQSVDCLLTKGGTLFLSWITERGKSPKLTAHHFGSFSTRVLLFRQDEGPLYEGIWQRSKCRKRS